MACGRLFGGRIKQGFVFHLCSDFGGDAIALRSFIAPSGPEPGQRGSGGPRGGGHRDGGHRLGLWARHIHGARSPALPTQRCSRRPRTM